MLNNKSLMYELEKLLLAKCLLHKCEVLRILIKTMSMETLAYNSSVQKAEMGRPLELMGKLV